MAKLALIILPVFYTGVVAAASTVSIANYPGLGQQHGCVQTCLNGNGVFTDVSGGPLSCDTPYVNNCFCATASAALASSFLSSCASSRCDAGDLPDDVTSAVSIYDGYCLTAGYTLPGASNFMATPAATTQNPNSPTVTVTQTVRSGTTTSTLSSSKSFAIALAIMVMLVVSFP
jgi:hypothetical protein